MPAFGVSSAKVEGTAPAAGAQLRLAAREEFALARHLMNFGITLEAVLDDYRTESALQLSVSTGRIIHQLLRELPSAKI
jgi:hypothetical protein